MDYPTDPGLRLVLTEMQLEPAALLGNGGEAWVYAIDATRVARVCHAGTVPGSVADRVSLLAELAHGHSSFAIPEIIDVVERQGRIVCIERRIEGISLLAALEQAQGRARANLIEQHLDVAATLGDLSISGRDWFGQLGGPNPIRADTWHDFLRDRADRSLAIAGFSELADPQQLAAEMPDCETPSFVHLDAFAGNMMVANGAVTAVIDFGTTCLIGDRRLDPISAAIYLATPSITPSATPGDVDVANAWLRTNQLDGFVEPVQRWLAAFWSFGVEDKKLRQWCHSVLTGHHS